MTDVFVPKFEQGYVSRADGSYAQPLDSMFLPMAATANALAIRFGGRVEEVVMQRTNFKVFIPTSSYFQPFSPFAYYGDARPVVQRFMVFAAGKVLPNGYVLQGEVRMEARFLAIPFALIPEDQFPGLAVSNCWAMIQRHDEQSR
jgi:hypothetical protein